MAARQPEGVVFPLVNGDRSTSDAGKRIFAAAFTAVGDEKSAQDVLNEKNWRHRYVKHIMKHVEVSLKTPENALESAKAGLEYMHNNFEFIRDGKTMKIADAMKNIKGSFETGFIKGTKPKPTTTELVIPYKGRHLRGDDLIQQLKKWTDYGTIEPSAADAISMVVKNGKWVDLSDRYFVLLGAGSAMGPYLILMALGANIIAVDLDRAGIWERLIKIAQDSYGTITFPLKKPQKDCTTPKELYENAGSNLITQAPEINNWLQTVYPDKKLTVGCYVYLDGENHVKVVLACDAIMKGMSERRKTGLAFLCTPTDIHVIPDEARRAALNQYNSLNWKNLLVLPIRTVMGHKMLTKNALRPIKANNGQEFSVVDGLTVPQGPNYALAKRMQHWRAVVARSIGCVVSSHIAPSTATVSVTSNRQFAWAYDGMPFFKPFEIFEQDTSNGVMSAILIHDLNNPKAAANPDFVLHNPLELFKYNSFNGGVWRNAYKVGSVGEVSVIVHFIKVLRPVLLVIFLVIVYLLYSRFAQ